MPFCLPPTFSPLPSSLPGHLCMCTLSAAARARGRSGITPLGGEIHLCGFFPLGLTSAAARRRWLRPLTALPLLPCDVRVRFDCDSHQKQSTGCLSLRASEVSDSVRDRSPKPLHALHDPVEQCVRGRGLTGWGSRGRGRERERELRRKRPRRQN